MERWRGGEVESARGRRSQGRPAGPCEPPSWLMRCRRRTRHRRESLAIAFWAPGSLRRGLAEEASGRDKRADRPTGRRVGAPTRPTDANQPHRLMGASQPVGLRALPTPIRSPAPLRHSSGAPERQAAHLTLLERRSLKRSCRADGWLAGSRLGRSGGSLAAIQ